MFFIGVFLLISNFISQDDEDCYRGRKEDIVLDTLRMEKQQKNWMINEKRVGKKKISWQDQVALRV